MLRGWIRVIICFGTSIMLLGFLLTGEISLLVAPKMRVFVGFSIFALIVLGLIQLWQLKEKELHRLGVTSYLIILFPIFLYFFILPKALDASIANKKGVQYSQPKSQQNIVVQNQSDDPYSGVFAVLKKQKLIVVTDKNYGDVIATIQIHPKELSGKQIRVKGFVYRDKSIAKHQFVVGRYSMVCCVADSQVIGYLVHWKKQKQLPVNKWVEVTGILKLNKREDGTEEAIIILNHIKSIAAPKDPYVYFS